MTLEKRSLSREFTAVSAAVILGIGAVSIGAYSRDEPGRATRGTTVEFDYPAWQPDQTMRIVCGEHSSSQTRTDSSPESPTGDGNKFTLYFADWETGNPYGVTVADLGKYEYTATTSDGQRKTIDTASGDISETIIKYPGPYDLRFTAGKNIQNFGPSETGTDHVDFSLSCIKDPQDNV